MAPNQQSMQRAPTGDPVRVLSIVSSEETQAERLHARLAPVVNRLVWSFLGVDADRDDLVHDIFVRILRRAHTVRDPAKLEDWAVRVTINAVKSEFRRRKLRRFFSLEAAERSPVTAYHPDFDGRELLLRTTRLLEALPVAERIPFTLQLLEARSVEDIAKLCGCSERTAKRRLKLARERFTRLAECDPLLRSRLTQAPRPGEEDAR